MYASSSLPEHQRAHAIGIAHADQLLRRQRDQRIGALDMLQRVDQPFDDRLVVAARREMDDGLGIGGRLEDRAFARPARGAAHRALVRLPLWAMREAAAGEIGEHRLHVARDRTAGRRIAHMADGVAPAQFRGVAVLAEDVADEADMALGGELRRRRRRRCRPLPGRDAEAHAGRARSALARRRGRTRRRRRIPRAVCRRRCRHREEPWPAPVVSISLSSALRSSAP